LNLSVELVRPFSPLVHLEPSEETPSVRAGRSFVEGDISESSAPLSNAKARSRLNVDNFLFLRCLIEYRWLRERLGLKRKFKNLKSFTLRPIQQLVKFFPNRTRLAIRKKASKLGLRADFHAHFKHLKKWSEEDIEILTEEYPKGRNVTELAKKLNKSIHAIRHKARELGLRVQDFRLYKVKDDAFSNWTEESAYWLGFISADGYLYEKNRVLVVTLSKRDEKHLMKLREFIATNNPIYTRHKRVTLRVRSDKIYHDLVALGITPRKSLRLEFPNIPKNFLRPYILGYSDGDGSIFYTKSGLVGWKVLGSRQFLETLAEIIKSKCGVKVNINKCSDCKSYYIQVTGEKAKRVLRWLYEGATVYLDRKYEKYKLCL